MSHDVISFNGTERVLRIGYGRTSTLDQRAGMEAQLRDLHAVGCEKLFHEQVSSVEKRPQLEACLDFVREGDTLVVTKLDRLARSTPHLLQIADLVRRKKGGSPYPQSEHRDQFGHRQAASHYDRGGSDIRARNDA